MRELHRQIVCDNPLTCRILNFLITIEQVLFDHRKCLVELKNFCKKLLERRKLTDFFSMVQWSWKKDKTFFTVRYLGGIREQQRKIMKRKVIKRKVMKGKVMKRSNNKGSNEKKSNEN